MGAVPAVGESFGGLVAGARVVLWLWLGAGFRGGGGALGAGGEYDVNGCVTNGLKFAPLRGEELEVVMTLRKQLVGRLFLRQMQ
jgi:hypothetical protein